MRARTVMLTLALLLATSGVLAAQAWDAPSFLPPRPGDDLGAYGVRPMFGDWGVMGIWRQSGELALGVRAGFLDLEGEETAVLVGSEFFGTLLRAGQGFPLDASWVLGLGATFDEGTLFRVPLGVSAGARLGTGATVFVPYAHPRIGLEVLSVDGESLTEWVALVDVGADLELGRSVILRAAGTFGGADPAFGAGAAVRLGRRVVAR